MVSNNLNLNLKLDQKLSPQMLQSLKLLQVNHLELQTLINQELEINPLLEIDTPQIEEPSENNTSDEDSSEKQSREEIDWETFFKDENLPKPRKLNTKKETLNFNPSFSLTLQDQLLQQLQMRKTTSEIKELVKYLINLLDDRGYLTFQDPLKALPIKQEKNKEKQEILLILAKELKQEKASLNVREAFHILTHFEPDGIGAKNLRECFLLQLYRKEGDFSLEIEILEKHFELLEKLKIPILAKKTRFPTKAIQKAIQNIGKLNPKPARVFDTETPLAVIPDAFIKVVNQEIIVSYNDSTIPTLNISNKYKYLIKKDSPTNQETKDFIKQKLNFASSLIHSIEQRKSTILKISESLAQKQKNFFLKGSENLIPMTLEDIALDIDMHISTVSRVVNEKFIQTPYGCYSLKYFFSSKIQNEQGTSISSTMIKNTIKILIQQENSSKPLSDERISILLKEKEIKIARRTVSKYREEMKILPAYMRKKF